MPTREECLVELADYLAETATENHYYGEQGVSL